MTQSFAFREPVSHDLGPQPTTMQHYNLMPNDGVMLERPGQKRRREISDFGLVPGNGSGNIGPPTVSGTTFCDLVAAQPSLAIEKQSFLDRMIHSARSGIFPLTGAGAVAPFEPISHHNVVDPAAAAHVARFRSGRSLESAAAATAQAMANFQALIDESRRSSNLFQACESGQPTPGFGAPSFRSSSGNGQSNGAPSFRSLSGNGQSNGAPSFRSFSGNGQSNGAPSFRSLPGNGQSNEAPSFRSLSGNGQSNEAPSFRSLSGNGQSNGAPSFRSLSGNGQSNGAPSFRSLPGNGQSNEAPSFRSLSGNGQSNEAPSFRSLPGNGQSNGAPSFRSLFETGPQSENPSFRSMQNGHGYGAPRFSFGNQTGFGDVTTNGHMSGEAHWPNLTCQTTSTRSLFESTTPQSPRTPRSNNTILSDPHQDYLNHMERMNAMATDPESPRHQRGRRLSFAAPESDVQIQAEKHVHIYMDPVDQAPEHVDDWGTTESIVAFGGDEAPQDVIPPVVAPVETERFDLNEVPVGNSGEAATPKPRKKYHPRVAKDKRTYKRRVDGKKTPASPAVDGLTSTNSPAKSKSGKRSSQQPHYDAINDESGRDAASHPEVVDMDIEYIGSSHTHNAQHNTALCDCEACIKLRLEKRTQQQSPESPQTWHNQPTFSESPPVRRTLFQSTPQPRQDQAPEARRSLACFDPPQAPQPRQDRDRDARRSLACFDPPQAPQPRQDCDPDARRSLACFDRPAPQQTMIPHHTTAYAAVKSFFTTTSSTSSCLQQFNESAALLGRAHQSLSAAIVPANPVSSSSNSFMSRLCPRGILSPQSVTFREMNQVQRIVYLRAILSSSNKLMMSSESLLRHVHEHLPEDEKVEFKEALWPIVLSELTSDQEKQLRDYAQLEDQAGGAIEVVKRKGPGRVKKSPQQAVKATRKGRKSNGMEMVPYEEKSLVPYEGPFDPLRKKKNRAKVVLDDETVRVWKMLMGKNGSERMESDAEKQVKWEEERRKMKAQAMNFIERMHIVMGDRSFSKWKGSVVDSVVGAFLTQNVNDVLSSSAFMSMRSRFPGRGFRNSSSEPEPPPDHQDQSLESELHQPPPSPPPQTSTISSEASSSQQPSPQNYPLPPVLNNEESRYDILAGAASTQEGGQGLELCCQKELECTSVVTEELSTPSREIEVVATDSLPSHGKYNPKTGLTGLERAQIEEKQVTARKDFDFSALQDEFRPRAQGQERLAAPVRTTETEDGVDWEAVRRANVAEVADVIKERGLNWILAGRIKAFLERIHLDYGALDLEWLRSMSTDQTKDFLLSIRGLGLKSVECIRLLTLHHLAFPVDTNVGRICVRLGWVPLEPLPEELQLHLLELYPVQATIQKYLWPRLCKFDHKTLYELHYQMISFGKVFCTKTKPNCNACPMRPECKHFASALSSAKLALPASESASNTPTLALPPGEKVEERVEETSRPVSQYCQPIIEEPMTPESEVDAEDLDIEDYPFSVQELLEEEQVTQQAEIDHILSPVINEAEPAPEEVLLEDWGCLAAAAKESQGCSPNSVIEIVDSPDDLDNFENPNVLVANSASQEMVLVAPETASLPVPKLKNVGRLRTVHYVYELPDNHPLLDGLDPRESDDPCTYLLAIWGPGEVPESIPNMNDSANEENGPCASSTGEETIKATLLVPCRTAMRGSFPLNGTYFQVNEVFADHASSLQPMPVPRTLLWNLRRRFVFFGTSVSSIFRGMTAAEIQACFWRGYVCVRGFDRSNRAPKPLVGRLHLQAGKAKGMNTDV